MQIKKMERQIKGIKAELALAGEMRPGSLNRQRTVCGRRNCRCIDPQNPRKHGPYYQLSYVHQGKSTSQFIQKEQVTRVRAQLKNYKKFKALTAKWIDLALAIAKENLRIDKVHRKNIKVQERNAFRGTNPGKR